MDPEQLAVAEPAAPVPAKRALLAPIMHTVVLVALLIAFSYLGTGAKHELTSGFGRASLYLVSIAWLWALVGYVWLGVRRRIRFRELIGGRWNSVEDGLMDVAIAVVFWFVAAAVIAGIGFLLGFHRPDQIQDVRERIGHIVPQSNLEILAWLGLSATAGFCEEVIFRGYLQRQLGAIAGSIWWGVAAQAVLFGASHGYEGPRRMLAIAVFGAMFGVLAILRRSLRPGMMAHFFQDVIAGLLARFVL